VNKGGKNEKKRREDEHPASSEAARVKVACKLKNDKKDGDREETDKMRRREEIGVSAVKSIESV